MNVFAVSDSPAVCGRMLDDCRLNKMILETAQLLCTAVHEHASEPVEGLYKSTHRNHPCAVWVRYSWSTFNWTLDLLEVMLDEYTRRTGKTHATSRLVPLLSEWESCIPDGGWIPQPNCTPHKGLAVHEAYKIYMYEKWMADYEAGRHVRYYSSTWRKDND